MMKIDPAVIVRAFVGMIIHHSLNNNLWDPDRRLLKISNRDAARQFTDILLNGISVQPDAPPSASSITSTVRKNSANGALRKK
jgi:hypothetical protein